MNTISSTFFVQRYRTRSRHNTYAEMFCRISHAVKFYCYSVIILYSGWLHFVSTSFCQIGKALSTFLAIDLIKRHACVSFNSSLNSASVYAKMSSYFIIVFSAFHFDDFLQILLGYFGVSIAKARISSFVLGIGFRSMFDSKGVSGSFAVVVGWLHGVYIKLLSINKALFIALLDNGKNKITFPVLIKCSLKVNAVMIAISKLSKVSCFSGRDINRRADINLSISLVGNQIDSRFHNTPALSFGCFIISLNDAAMLVHARVVKGVLV